MKILQKIILGLWLVLFPFTAQAAQFGIDGFLSTRMNSGEMTTAADLIGAMDAKWVRQEFNYNNIGGANGTNFGADDEAADKSIAKGLSIFGLLSFSERPNSTDWESFVGNTVGHFKDKVKNWEIFNEENDYLSASGYNDYLQKSYDKIKSIDSGAKVITGGTSEVAVDFLEGLASAGGCNNFDAIGIHPYRGGNPEKMEFGKENMRGNINQAVAFLNRRCSGKKIWVTEVGYKSNEVGESNQANWLARSFILAATIGDVERATSYNFRDDNSGQWGVVNSSFGKKESYNRVKDAFANLNNKNFSDVVLATSQSLLDDMNSTDGWDKDQSNATVSFSSVGGRHDNAVKLNYSFTSGSAYAELKKPIQTPSGITGFGVWIKGDNSKNLWRFRFKDSNGETFQYLVGTVPSEWNYYVIDIANGARSSFGGDGSIQYPITFQSILIDRNGGASSGSGYIDDITAITGANDFYAYRFGSTAVAWKVSGSGSANICGQNVTLGESPTFLGVNPSSCVSTISGAEAPTATSEPSPTATATATQTATTSPAAKSSPTATQTAAGVSVSAEKSKVEFDKTSATTDGKDRILEKIYLKDKDDKNIKSDNLKVEVSGSNNMVSTPEYKDDHYEVRISSTKAEKKEIKTLVGSLELNKTEVIFNPGPLNKDKSKFVMDKICAIASGEDALKVTFEARDESDNPIGGKIWTLSTNDSTVKIEQPGTGNDWKAIVRATKPGKKTLNLFVDNQDFGKSIDIYFNPLDFSSIKLSDLPVDRVFSLELKSESSGLAEIKAKPEEIFGFKIKSGAKPYRILTRIEDGGLLYSCFSKIDDENFEGLIQAPKKDGDYLLAIWAEDGDGKMVAQEKIKLIISKDSETGMTQKKRIPLWAWIVGAIVLGLASGITAYEIKRIKARKSSPNQ